MLFSAFIKNSITGSSFPVGGGPWGQPGSVTHSLCVMYPPSVFTQKSSDNNINQDVIPKPQTDIIDQWTVITSDHHQGQISSLAT